VAIVLPEVVGKLTLIDATTVTAGVERQPDLIWQIGEDVRIRTVWQHQSSSDPAMDLRVFRDSAVLLEAWSRAPGPLPALVTVVVTHGPRDWTAPKDVRERMGALPPHFDALVPRCPYSVLDLREIPDDRLATAPLAARIALVLLRAWGRHGPSLEMWHAFAALAPEVTELAARLGASAYRTFLRYLTTVTPRESREKAMALLTQHDDSFPPGFVSMADAWLMEGEQRGIEKGRRADALELLLSLGNARFGPPSASTVASLEQLGVEALHERALRLFTATSWADLLE
jgi:hypothetical protein